jgi:predicted nucleic acid-binding protein
VLSTAFFETNILIYALGEDEKAAARKPSSRKAG